MKTRRASIIRSRRVFCVASLLGIFVAPVQGAISLSIVARLESGASELGLDLTVANQGDDSAHDVQLVVRYANEESELPPQKTLFPGHAMERAARLPLSHLALGRHPLIVTLSYSDVDGNRTSTVLCDSFVVGVVGDEYESEISGRLTPVTIEDEGVLEGRLESRAERSLEIEMNLFSSSALTFGEFPARLSLSPGESRALRIPLVNASALPGSRYPACLTIQYDTAGRHHTSIVVSDVSVVRSLWAIKLRTPLAVAAGLLVVLGISLSLKARRASDVPVDRSAGRQRRLRTGTNVALLLLAEALLLSYFEPGLLFLDTTPAGGDTPSHFLALERLREFMLEHGQLTGWDYGNLGGFPLLQYYFPLPFVLGVALSLLLPLTVSFKLVTVLGVFLLPLAAFHFLDCLRAPFPAPAIGALGSLAFLLVESQSMWGGNLLSTLSGEFAYSIGMALVLFYLAAFHESTRSTSSGVWRPAFLLALTGLSHGCALLVGGAVSGFYVLQGKSTYTRLIHYVKVNVLAFLLMAFWLVPWFATQEFMTSFNSRWRLSSIAALFPLPLIPFFLPATVSGIHLLWRVLRRRQPPGSADGAAAVVYLGFSVLVSLVYYRIAYPLNVIDIRFIPFAQLFLVLMGAVGLGGVLRRVPSRWPFALALGLVTVWCALMFSTMPQSWIQWNYEGYELKSAWPRLQRTTQALSGTFGDGRVAYEHSADHDEFGSTRVFETLPHLSGRATLEGVYTQAAVTSPPIFYIQSEISKQPSCPLPGFPCSPLNLAAAISHLELFNVSHLILRSPEAKEQASTLEALRLVHSAPPLNVYRVNVRNGYATPLECLPVLYTGPNWQRESYPWFREYRSGSRLVAIDSDPSAGAERFAHVEKTFPAVEACASEIEACEADAVLEHDRIRISTSCVDRPVLIKISYHPRWQVNGAERIYLVAPGFMLVYPERENVELRFGWSRANYLGFGLTALALFIGLGQWMAPIRLARLSSVVSLPESTRLWLESSRVSQRLKIVLVMIAFTITLWLAR